MSYKNLITKLRRYHRRLNGCTICYDCSRYQPLVREITAAAEALKNAGDEDLTQRALRLKNRARDHSTGDDLLVESFALVKEAITRVLKTEPFDEQIIGGIVLHKGKIAEMQTGEGKTMTAVFPAFLNALSGKGVHVITFNDYLAGRDAAWMGPVYRFLGLGVGHVQERMSVPERQRAYAADVTYVTAKEAGFDFLRDSLCYDSGNTVHREFHYAIIDEADSILIDEARIPLIIAGISGGHGAQSDASAKTEHSMARLVRGLCEDEDFEFDAYQRNVFLTEKGLERVEGLLRCDNLYAPESGPLLARLHFALHAEYLLHRDKDYIVRNGAVELIDDFTGRVADKRRWPDGLQAAVEAKEDCDIRHRGVILNSIALQHFLQRYPRICGMTATAQISEEEFREFYGLHIVVVPQHKPCIRNDHPDTIYRTKAEKRRALIEEIVRVHKTGRPILVGTQSVAESSDLAAVLREQGLQCEVLNAKRDAFEAGIVARAGELGALTISTNMAGRGTDIRLGGARQEGKERVRSLGGLYVIGTNRHESRRVDNQLRGRAGRQGDPGSSRFFISLEDDLYRQYRLNELIPSHALSGGDLDNPVVRIELNRLQRIIEGQHLEIKKTLFRYSFMLEQQRRILFRKRSEILVGTAVLDFYRTNSGKQYGRLLAAVGEQALLEACRNLSLAHLDKAWSSLLAEIDEIRECIHFRMYGKQDPYFEYNKCAIELFNAQLRTSDEESLKEFNRITVANGRLALPPECAKAPSATWTYLINDNPFEDTYGMQMLGATGYSAWAGLLWPLMALAFLVKRIGAKKETDKNK